MLKKNTDPFMKRRLVVVVKYFHPIKRPSGISSFLLELCRNLSDLYDLHVVSIKHGENVVSPIKHSGFTIHKVSRPFPLCAGIKAYSLKPDILITFSGIINPMQALLYFGFIRIISMAPYSIFTQCTHFSLNTLQINSLSKYFFNRFVGMGPEIYNYLNTISDGGATMISPAVNISQLENIVPVKKNANFFRIGFFGHFSYGKGVDRLINVFIKLNMPNTDLFLAGGRGSLLEMAKKTAKKHNNIKLFTYVENVLSYIKSCDIVVLPYRTSVSVLGTAQTAIEAMAMGVPCIGTNTPALSHLINNDINGYIINSEKELQDRIYHMIKAPKKRIALGINAKKTIQEYYTIEKIALKFNHTIINSIKTI